MTLLTVGRRREASTIYPLPRSASVAPWNSSDVPCTIPTYDGVGATVHPSVVDMGARWNGYRWWMANTPYAAGNDDLENPCIWGSNDRLAWTVPAGLTNPIDPNPGNPWFHSDTELVWNPETSRLIVFYRLALGDGTLIYLRAQSSPDGTTWTDHGTVMSLPLGGARLSPAIERVSAGVWRMWTFADSLAAHMWTASDPLGPWTDAGACTRAGAAFTGWHGDVIRYDGKWIAAYSTGIVSGVVAVATSADGLAWTAGASIMASATGGGWDTRLYRPTLLPSTEAGFIDCWYSSTGSVPGGWGTDYVRLPASLWPDPPA